MIIMKKIKIIALILLLCTFTEAYPQNVRKKVWDAVRKTWTWVVEKEPKKKIKPHYVKVNCGVCNGNGKIIVTVPIQVWNPYYQMYQTQYRQQVQWCTTCGGSGKITKKYYY